MATLIIGDIHGCYEELGDLLDRAAITTDDHIISVGDAIHRGPDSLAVVEFLTGGGARGSGAWHTGRWRRGALGPACTMLLGNHERKHLQLARRRRPLTGEAARLRREAAGGYGQLLETFAALPRWLELPEVCVVHAALEPDRDWPDQDERVLTGTLAGQKRLAQRYNQPWWQLYGPSRPVVVGHHDFHGDGRPFVYRDRVFGLDTGCARGGRLTGLLLPSFRLVSVPSRRGGVRRRHTG